ncbi:toll/interleukin-1 receptor domain-containing protein [Pedobacter alluvionis]|uniref:TIR domain-containing protein n=1 Tax=Pedobacter alluvionis TaxID=475253 RepID=A0A497XXQ0_9SPHI|nr:toll/interleukin-1 receptor domain-containing protein [Pedobacter alluvionis]RLJ73668.1 TIR domain-containing protein [Pedobacter alluvionis]TFB32708.1 toll/interleukin-1 receptor domain-containing protein [Pedobacter alluvionis]
MSVFISYSSKDREFVDKLAFSLVAKRIKIWLDKWEMHPGDSLIDKIQEGLTESGYLLVVLSKHSVESEWCRKELNSGLMREIEEKKAHVIPVVIDDCKVPLFLREKLYADFRTDFDAGLAELMRPLSALFSEHMGRNVGKDTITDYAINWGTKNNHYHLAVDLITWYIKEQKSILVQLTLDGNAAATERYNQQVASGLPFVMKEINIGMMKESEIYGLRMLLETDKTYFNQIEMGDSASGISFMVGIRALQMGVDNDKNLLLDLSDYLDMLYDGSRQRVKEDQLKYRP